MAVLKLTVITCVFLLIISDTNRFVESRGGGGRGGGRGRSSSSSRSRTSGKISAKTKSAISRYHGPEYRSRDWNTGKAEGLVYGLASYKQTQRYLKYPDREPTVCFNAVSPKDGKYGYFICPEEGMSILNNGCCGERGDERCCRPGRGEATAGGILIALSPLPICAVIACCCYLCIKGKCDCSCRWCDDFSCCMDKGYPLPVASFSSGNTERGRTQTSTTQAATVHEAQPLSECNIEINGSTIRDHEDEKKISVVGSATDQLLQTDNKEPS